MNCRWCRYLILLLALLGGGCAVVAPPPAAVPEPLPPPTDTSLNATLKLDLPPALATAGKVPAVAQGPRQLKLRAQAIAAAPLRSRFDGTFSLDLAVPDGQRRYLQCQTELHGEYDGSPNEGLERALQQVAAVLRLFRDTPPPAPALPGALAVPADRQ